MKKFITLFLLFSIHPLFAQNEFIPFQSLEAGHKGTAAWIADGTGPEPSKKGHTLTWLTPSTDYYAYYYIASRDYNGIDADANAAALSGTGTISGFPTFVAALASNGFSVTDITMKYTIQTLGNDVQGVDWTYTSGTTTETRTYKGGNWVIYLNGQQMVGGASPNMNMTIIYNDLLNFADDQISGISDFVIPNNLSASSPATVQACASAFLSDVGNYGIRYNFSSLQPAIQTVFTGTGRTGAFFIAQNGKFEKGNSILPVELTSFQATRISDYIQLNWKTATEMNNMGFEIERSISNGKTSKEEWNKIGFIPGSGTTTALHEYSYTDRPTVEGAIKYRLKQIDVGGTFEYSQIIEVDFTQPKEFALYQNYPNPFNPTTVIKYAIPADSKVVINIYNSLGQEVTLLKDGIISAGNYEVTFNTSHLSSGIYFYSITAQPLNGGNTFSQVKKMILVK